MLTDEEIKNQLTKSFISPGISAPELIKKMSDEKLFHVIRKILGETQTDNNCDIHFSPMEFLCLIENLPFIEHCIKILRGNPKECCDIRLLERCWARISFKKVVVRRKRGVGKGRPKRCKSCGYLDMSPLADKCPNCDESH